MTACTPEDQTASLAAPTPARSAPTSAEATFGDFQKAFESGTACARLFQIRNDVPPKDPRQDEMNDMLRSVECFSPTSTRQAAIAPAGTGTPAPANYVSNYRISYDYSCQPSQAEQLYRESGTRDPEEAAEWLSLGVTSTEVVSTE